MISLIICCRTPQLPLALEQNIKRTIGAVYELIILDNSTNKYNIFEAYNQGVSQSSYPYLCFMHDDILYFDDDWGLKAIAHFNDSRTGAIGIAGSPYYSKLPGSWWAGGLVNETLASSSTSGISVTNKSTSHPIDGKVEVVVLDGVWICIRRSVFDKILFDEVNFTGFHFYDMDICMQVHASGYKLFATTDIAIQHFYNGKLDTKWIENARIFQRKWKSCLPASVINLTAKERAVIDYKTVGEYIRILLANNFTKSSAYLAAIVLMLRFYSGYIFLPGMLLKRFQRPRDN